MILNEPVRYLLRVMGWTAMNTLVGLSRRQGWSTVFHRLAALASLGAIGLVSVAAGPPDMFPRPGGDSDLDLTLRVKAALSADSSLIGVDPVVSVVDRVAVVGGPVPSESAAARLADVLRKVPGLTSVKVSCWVEAPDDPLKKLIASRLKPGDKPDGVPGLIDTPPSSTIVAAMDHRPSALVVAQRATPSMGGLLMDPVSPRSTHGSSVIIPPPPAGNPQYATIPAPSVPVKPKQDLAAAVEEMRRTDTRFARLTTEVRGDKVVISGQAADGDAWDLAATIRRIPGVGSVSLGRIDSR